MLVNDPPVPDPADPAKLDDKMFKGRAMTYYGRWTYKYEIAAEKGAAAADHRPRDRARPATRSPWSTGSWRPRELRHRRPPTSNVGRVAVEGWVTLESGEASCSPPAARTSTR